MEILERYLYAIQRRLPLKTREDITKEIKSLIFDELEGNFGKKDTYEAVEMEQVVKEMGSPRTVASRYRNDKEYLIGPELFPFYKMILAISAGATTIGLLVSFIVGCFAIGGGNWEGIKYIAEFIGSVFSTLVGLVGTLTIVFAIIERVSETKFKGINLDDEFKPKDLPELPTESDKVTLAGSIIASVFIVLGLYFINTFVRTGEMPFVYGVNQNVHILPIFILTELRQYLPFWNISGAISLIIQMIHIRTGRWNLGTRLLDIFTNIIGLAVLIFMLNSEMVISLDALANTIGDFDWIVNRGKDYYTLIKVLIGLSSFGILVSTIKLIVQQARKANV